jgi:hypothetical protein
MDFRKLTIISGILLGSGGALHAGAVYNYAFGGTRAADGKTSYTFAPLGGGSPTITASGFALDSDCDQWGSKLSAVGLYSSGTGSMLPPRDNSGLGLANDGDHEITAGSFVMLNLSKLEALPLSSLDIYLSGSNDGGRWEIWGSNTAASAGHVFSIPAYHSSNSIFGSGDTEVDISKLQGDKYIYITAIDCGGSLLGGLTATTATPEPGSAALLGLAFAGSGLVFRRRLARQRRNAQDLARG